MDNATLQKVDGATIISEEYTGNSFVVMPDIVASSNQLTPSEKMVFSLIYSFIVNGKECIASNGYFMKRLGLSLHSVQKALNSLEKNGLIKREMEGQERKGITTSKNWYMGIAKNGIGGIAKNDIPVYQNLLPYNKAYNKVDNKDIQTKSPSLKEKRKPIQRHTDFLERFNDVSGRSFRLLEAKTLRQIDALIDAGYSLEEWGRAVSAAKKDRYLTGANDRSVNYLTPEFISRPEKFEKYLNQRVGQPKQKLDTDYVIEQTKKWDRIKAEKFQQIRDQVPVKSF